MDKRHQADYYKRTNEGGFSQVDYRAINDTESVPSLIQRINRWLERMPFFDENLWAPGRQLPTAPEEHPFWLRYRELYRSGLTERESGKAEEFDYVFFDKIPASGLERVQGLRTTLGAPAMRAALFTMLYRHFPVFQNSFAILDTLVDIDNQLAGWRHAHYRMVRRMIGMRVGTGNTSGQGYLEGAVSKHFIFRDIAGLSTYLIERKKLPKLPEGLIERLGFVE
jgi:tryptophan 2,3-dioxygenase